MRLCKREGMRVIRTASSEVNRAVNTFMGLLRSCPDWALAHPAPLHDLKLITQPGIWIQTRSLSSNCSRVQVMREPLKQ